MHLRGLGFTANLLKNTIKQTRSRQISSLVEPLAGVEQSNKEAKAPVLTTSTLSNGIKVVSYDNGAPSAGVSVFAKSGCRYETNENLGSSHFLKHMALKSNRSQSALRVNRLIELATGEFHVNRGREFISYNCSLTVDNLADVLPIMSDMLQPRLPEWEIREAREFVAADHSAADEFKDLIYQVAYRYTGLGNPGFASATQAQNLDPETLQNYAAANYVGNRVAVVGVGVDHKTLVKSAEESFKNIPSSSDNTTGSAQAVYGGGEHISTTSGNTEIAVAFEGAGRSSANLVPTFVLSTLLGGGVKHRGTPGAGLTSLAKANIVDKYDFVKCVSPVINVFSDSGVIGLHGVATPGNAAQFADVLVSQIRNAASGLKQEDLDRAIETYRARAKFWVESREGLTHFLGQQALHSNNDPVDISNFNGDGITVETIQNLVKSITTSPCTVVARGDASGIPKAL